MRTLPEAKILIFFILLTFMVQTYSAEPSAVLVHDAAFSPDGKSIGIGTNTGFHLLDWKTKNVVYRFPVKEGVKFIKWAPDINHVLLASWQDQEAPTYSLLDIGQNRILFSFQDEIRWFYQHFKPENMYGDIAPGFTGLKENIVPNSTELGHTNSLVFSSDGTKLAYITNEEGSIRVRYAEDGTLLQEFSLPDYHATSLGYTQEGDRIWVGIIVKNEVYRQDRTRLLYLNSANGEILEMQQIRPMHPQTYPHFWVYAMRPDRKYAFAISSIDYDPSAYYLKASIYLVDLTEGVVVQSIAGGVAFYAPLRPHAIFNGQKDIFGLSRGDYAWDGILYDYQDLSFVGYPYDNPIPAEPYAPDGSQFLMIDNFNKDRIYMVNSITSKRQEFIFQPTPVEDYRQHEPVKD